MKPDLVSILEAAYRPALSDDAWVTGVLRAAAPALDRGLGLHAFLFDVSNPEDARLWSLTAHGPTARETEKKMSALGSEVPSQIARALCEGGPRCVIVHPTSPRGPAAFLAVRARDASGVGCAITVHLPGLGGRSSTTSTTTGSAILSRAATIPRRCRERS